MADMSKNEVNKQHSDTHPDFPPGAAPSMTRDGGRVYTAYESARGASRFRLIGSNYSATDMQEEDAARSRWRHIDSEIVPTTRRPLPTPYDVLDIIPLGNATVMSGNSTYGAARYPQLGRPQLFLHFSNPTAAHLPQVTYARVEVGPAISTRGSQCPCSCGFNEPLYDKMNGSEVLQIYFYRNEPEEQVEHSTNDNFSAAEMVRTRLAPQAGELRIILVRTERG
ncbi:hypothetical protein C8R44DRAFT_733873 [Mycena epipterygia]|nr:hypothetical protein C8R44DRAFT_733873 [Mycena epipterygia]